MFILLLCLLLNLCVCEEWTTEKVIAAIEDPPLRDILESAVKKLEGLKAESQTELKEIEASLKGMVDAVRRRVAATFKGIRPNLFLDEPILPAKNTSADKGGNSSELHERPRPVMVDHLGNMDSFFRTWIPKIKKDIEMSALVMNGLADSLGAKVHDIATRAAAELRRLPIKYSRLRFKLTKEYANTMADNHHEMHKKRVIQSECGKQYTLEQFVEIFDHDHNLALTEEPNWTQDFTDEFYEGWPVFANHMRLSDPACGSRKWSLPPATKIDKSEL